MAAAFDTSSVAESNSGTTLTWTHTPAGTPTLALVCVHYIGTSALIAAAPTYAAQATTLIGGPVREGDNTVYVYKLESPPSGAQSVSFTLDQSGKSRHGVAVTFTGTIGTRTTATADNNSGVAQPSVAATTVAGDLVFDFLGIRNPVGETVGADQTQRFDYINSATSNNLESTGSTEVAVGVSTTMSWTLSTSRDWSQVAVPIIGQTLESAAVDIATTTSVAVAASIVANESAAVAITTSTSVAIAASVQIASDFPIEPCRVEVFATGSPATVYVALLSYPWGPARVPVELSGNGYARVAVPNTSAYWEPQGTGVGNAHEILFPVALADLGTVTGWAIYDDPTLATAEHLLANGRLPTPRPIPEATYPQFTPNNLFISLDACGGTLMVYELAADLWSGYEGWVEDSEWGRCQTCDHTVPVRELLLNPRYGWQCITGQYGIGCWDGLIQRDEIIYIPPPDEGARRSPSPTDGISIAADAPPQLNDD